LNYWESLGFKKEKNKNSKSYANSIKSLRKVLSGKAPWEGMTLSRLKHYCEILKVYSESNRPHMVPDGETFIEPNKLYFHQFVMTYFGYSYLKDVMSGKIKGEVVSDDVKEFAEEISNVLYRKLTRKVFSSGEYARINKFAHAIHYFYEDKKDKIAVGIDKMTIVRGIFRVIDDFRKIKGIPPDFLIYTGNYAAGYALERAMEQNGYWKIYSKYEDPNECVQKDPDKAEKVVERLKKKEEDDLPDIVKRRREELKKHGILKKQEDNEDCSRKEAYLRGKAKPKRNPFSGR
jgi:hypothetical protein